MLDKKERLAILFFGIAAATFMIGVLMILQATTNQFGAFGLIGSTNSAIELKLLVENQPDYIYGWILMPVSLLSAIIAIKLANS